jgi:spermidine export protein MdtJ
MEIRPGRTQSFYWIFLISAIVAEVIGTLAMRFSLESTPIIGLSIMYITLLLSYSFLAIAVQRISLAVAYGAWECLGLILVTLFSVLLFSESLSRVKISAIVLILTGIFLVDYGTVTYNKT